jgi:hypothetical protein
MQRLTCAARPAFAIVADSSDVLMLGVDEEDVCSTAKPLRAPFEPSSIGGESRKIHVLTDNYEKINILWVLPIGANGSEEADALDRKLSYGANELGSQSEEIGATLAVRSWNHYGSAVLIPNPNPQSLVPNP